jgi:MarR family transcriptional regulator, transcriptional regulator for hemolysin
MDHLADNPSDDFGDNLGFLIVDSARLLRAAFERRISEAGLGLTPGEARALMNVASADGSRQLDIAARMGVEPMTLCAYLDKLQALGLIHRQQCVADRRAKRVTLTELSEPMVAAIRREFEDILAQATVGLDNGKINAVREALDLINSNLQLPALPPAAMTASHESR